MDSLMTKRAVAFSDAHEREHLRALGNAIRARALSKLPDLLERLEANLTRNGVQVHWAETVDQANEIVMFQVRSFGVMFMVFATAPLGLIGAVPTLLLFNQPFGFNAILGLIGIGGILMRLSSFIC